MNRFIFAHKFFLVCCIASGLTLEEEHINLDQLNISKTKKINPILPPRINMDSTESSPCLKRSEINCHENCSTLYGCAASSGNAVNLGLGSAGIITFTLAFITKSTVLMQIAGGLNPFIWALSIAQVGCANNAKTEHEKAEALLQQENLHQKKQLKKHKKMLTNVQMENKQLKKLIPTPKMKYPNLEVMNINLDSESSNESTEK